MRLLKSACAGVYVRCPVLHQYSQVFDLCGKFLFKVGDCNTYGELQSHVGLPFPSMSSPTAVAFDSEGHVLIAEQTAYRIQVVDVKPLLIAPKHGLLHSFSIRPRSHLPPDAARLPKLTTTITCSDTYDNNAGPMSLCVDACGRVVVGQYGARVAALAFDPA